jgi:hypothetical protein
MYVCRSKQETRKEILDLLALRVVESKPAASMRQIARHLARHPNGHLMDILWGMVEDDLLVANPRQHRPDVVAWDFQIPAHKIDHAIGQVYEVQK